MRNVRMTIWVMVASLCLINSMALADCPPADLTGNCKVDFEDFAVMASDWLLEGVPEPVVNFGKLVVERMYRFNDYVFVDFVKEWLDGKGRTKNAELMYKDQADSDVRRVSFFGLRPTSYCTIPHGFIDPFVGECQEYIIEHVEFSVEHVDIENAGSEFAAFADHFSFEFGGQMLGGLSVKPPEIYFGLEVQSPQFFDNFHINAGFCGQTDIRVTGMGWDDRLWSLVEGGGINMKYSFRGNISEAKGEDVTLQGHLLDRDLFVDWMNSWIDGLESPHDILINYDDYQMNFINAMPTSYILPAVNSSWKNRLQESFSFTYQGITGN